jgi:coenzyme F420 biosynthesis associated uncharacterized protein
LSGIVDWDLAARVAAAVAREGSARAPAAFGQAAVERACEEALPAVIAYSGLQPEGAIPRPEAVGRAEWSRAGLATMREVASGLEERMASGLNGAGPLAGVARALAGGATGAEAGFAVGYAARRVLGQFDISLLGEPRPPRLLFVSPNIAATHSGLEGSAETLVLWIAAHETTHAVQFASVGWLRGHLAGLLEELIEGTARRLGPASLAGIARRVVRSDPRRTIRAALRGELPRILMSGLERDRFDRLQAAMAVIEGHAEHVMDAALGDGPELARLRSGLEARRASRGGLGEVVARLFGLDLKLRQYRQGKRFCDAVVAEGGIEALNRAWSAPAAMPRIDELERPQAWLARVVPAVTSA